MLAATSIGGNAAASMNLSAIIPGVMVYVVLGGWFLAMGIGSVKARRWARALVLVSSWVCLVFGLTGLVAFLLFMPDMFDKIAESGAFPKGMAVVMKYATMGFIAVFLVLIPGVHVLFYGSKHVWATCQTRDPRLRWTDRCPLPVLALSLMAAFMAVSSLSIGFYGWATPFFGVILSGPAGAAVVLAWSILYGYVAWGTYRLSPRAWWCAVLLVIGSVLSVGLTFSRVSLLDLYEKMSLPPEQMKIMPAISTMLSRSYVMAWIGPWGIGSLAYLIYTRKYFVHPTQSEDKGGE